MHDFRRFHGSPLPLCMFVVLCLLLTVVTGRAQTVPPMPRTGANLFSNTIFNGTSGWTLSAGAVYDASTSRTADGSGSIRLPAGTQATVTSANIAATPGQTYTMAVYIRTNGWPPGNVTINIGKNGGTYIGDSGAGLNSQTGVWEEMVVTVTPDSTVSTLNLNLQRSTSGDAGVGDVWVDEVYFGTGVGFGSNPAAKTPFAGQYIKVDALGNFSILRGGSFQPFFPFCIYGDSGRPNYEQVYSDQGLNCDVWAGSLGMAAAATATSSYNSNGMMGGVQIAQYMWPDGWGWDPNGVNLTNEIHGAKSSGYPDHVLWYYWDNEVHWGEWNNPMNMLAYAEAADTVGGNRQSPIYVLQGAYNATRGYVTAAGHVPTNLTGTYTDNANTGGAAHGAGGLIIQQRLQDQTIPTTVYQANIVNPYVAPGGLRSTFYAGLIKGARALGLFADCYQNASRCTANGAANDVTQTQWWGDVPNIRRELDQLLPLIQQPHWTSWTVSYNTALPLDVGTRDYNGSGHILVSNTSTSAQTVTFTMTGLSYTPVNAVDYFSGAVVTGISSNAFTTTIPANGISSGTKVFVLASSGINQPTVTLSASSTMITPGQSVTLTWSSTFADSCMGSGFNTNGHTSETDTNVTVAPTVTTSYSIQCTGAGGQSNVSQVTITVGPLSTCPLLLRWRFDEGMGTTTADDSPSHWIGTLNGTPLPAWSTNIPPIGTHSLSFTNTDNQYVGNASFAWPANTEATFEWWMNIPTSGYGGGGWQIGPPPGPAIMSCNIPWTDATMYCQYTNVSNYIAYGGFSTFNVWHHFAFTANAAQLNEYVDGVLAGNSPVANDGTLPPAQTGVRVGAIADPNGTTFYPYVGMIDEFQIYGCVKTAAQILADYQATSYPPSFRANALMPLFKKHR